MEYSGNFSVTAKRSEVVAAALPLQEHWLPLTNLDLLLPPLDVGIFICYEKKYQQKNCSSSENCMVAVFKKALAQVLVAYYPFAGEMTVNRLGEPEIHCNNRGVDFTHAYADVELKKLDLYRPDLSVQGKLVPVKMNGILSVQVTELKCGGLVVGCTFDHRVADAHSANMFLSSWAELARSPPQPITPLPSFRRSCFNPRRPLQPHKSLDKLYAPPPPPPPSDHNNHNHLTSRIYLIKSESIHLLQSQSTTNGTKRSKIESFSAFLWKTLAAAAAGDRGETVKLGIVIDGRTRLGGRSTPMDRYFGNVLSIPYIEATVADLETASLKELASRVHGCVAALATAEHFLGLIDWVEMRRPKSAVARVYCKDESDECAVVVSSGLRFPVLELDFGSGRPVFGSYHFPWGGETGYVMPMLSACGNGDWVVYMHLMQEQLDLVEARASHVFRPFHLNLATHHHE